MVHSGFEKIKIKVNITSNAKTAKVIKFIKTSSIVNLKCSGAFASEYTVKVRKVGWVIEANYYCYKIKSWYII